MQSSDQHRSVPRITNSFILLALIAGISLVGSPFMTQNANASTQIAGTATACTGLATCSYAIGSSSGNGWASTSSSSISFQLPGESKGTYGQPYSTQIVSVSGTTNTVAGAFTAIDANTGKVVSGSTNTVIIVTKHCGYKGCQTSYTLVSGTIAFIPTNQDGTIATVTCDPSNFLAGGSTTCTAKVIDEANSSNFPNGKVTFTNSFSSLGTFSNGGKCTLSSGSCSVHFTPYEEVVGTIPIHVAYKGNHAYSQSTGSTLLYVTPS